jgi:hypothetical protein
MNNIFLKKNIKSNNDSLKDFENDNIDNKYYINENLYDVIIIDESHEHNKNMDMILSIIKYSLIINTSIKLIITSATLNDDEHIYRSFYKNIDNDYVYPMYNMIRRYPIGVDGSEGYNIITSNVVDKRIHIAPYGIETLYEVEEIYQDKYIENYEIAEKLGIEKILDLCQNKIKGDILFFSVT